MSFFIRLLATAACLLMTTGSPFAYPTEGNHPHQPWRKYGDPQPWLSAISTGNLYFVSDLPNTYSEAERFILWGCDSEVSDKAYRSMVSELFITLSTYHKLHGQIPTAISKSVIDEVSTAVGRPTGREIDYEMLRSPITGRFPSLNAMEFSAGDFYVKVLEGEELDRFAGFFPDIKNLLAGQGRNPNDGSSEKLFTPVFYIRVYGETEVIMTTLRYGSAPASN